MDKVGILVWQGHEVLTVRKHGRDVLILPGGKPEPTDSTARDTLTREIREELNCSIDHSTLRWIGLFEDESADDAGEVVRVHLFEGSLHGDLRPDHEIAEYRWFDPDRDDLSLLAPSIRDQILPSVWPRRH